MKRIDSLRIALATTSFVALLVTSGVAPASDGVLEINQVCVTNTGCFTGDTSGFPVRISSAGSYRLTSNLDPGTADAIVVGSVVRDVTIDLNGFRIVGAGGGSGTGIRGEPGASAITIRNGTIQSMGGDGIDIGGASVVESVNVLSNLGDGIDVDQTSIVRDSRIAGNDGYGIRFLGSDSLYSGNVFSDNTLGAVTGGTPGGVNLCDDSTCSSAQSSVVCADFGMVEAPGFCIESQLQGPNPPVFSNYGAVVTSCATRQTRACTPYELSAACLLDLLVDPGAFGPEWSAARLGSMGSHHLQAGGSSSNPGACLAGFSVAASDANAVARCCLDRDRF